MKIARVLIQDLEGYKKGDIYEVAAIDSQQPARASAMQEVEVADEFDPAIHDAVFAEDGSISFEINATKQSAKVNASKAAQIAVKYNEMNAAVLAAMATAFGTSNVDSALAQQQTLKEMVQTPSDWSGDGLVVDVPTTNFAIGDALDTNQKVTDFANERLAVIKAYGIFRMKRIQQFRDEKAAIEAG